MKNLFLALATLLAALAMDANAGVRTASLGVSATVLASCRIDVPSHSANLKVVHRGQCSGTVRPTTQAVVETLPMALTPVAAKLAGDTFVQVNPDTGAATRWIRFDVVY